MHQSTLFASTFARLAAIGVAAAAVAVAVAASPALARPTVQTAAFTYQGQLKQGGSPVNGSVDLQFKLFDAAASGNQIGSTLAANAGCVVVVCSRPQATLTHSHTFQRVDVRRFGRAITPPRTSAGWVRLRPHQVQRRQ